MVFSPRERKEVAMEMETMNDDDAGGERSLKAPLHNFVLPSFMNWGVQRRLRCKLPKKESGGLGDDGKKCGGGNRAAADKEGIDAVREKKMSDLKTTGEMMKDAMFRKGVSDEEEDDEKEGEEDDVVAKALVEVARHPVEEIKRWNLRTRKGSNGSTGITGVAAASVGYHSFSPMMGLNGGTGEEKKRAKFSLELSKKEIEEDFMAMVGHQPPLRPKKHPKTVQRQLDRIFPGSYLSEVNAKMYKVQNPPNPKV